MLIQPFYHCVYGWQAGRTDFRHGQLGRTLNWIHPVNIVQHMGIHISILEWPIKDLLCQRILFGKDEKRKSLQYGCGLI